MILSILTTITNPHSRQDKWLEALECYSDLADEVVVVNGGVKVYPEQPNVKVVDLPWPKEWNWLELPRHLNAGLEEATGDWVLKLDIDQLIHEDDFEEVRDTLEMIPDKYDVATLQKMSFTFDKKYYQKGGQPIAFRNRKYIKIGKDLNRETDLCFPIKHEGYEDFKDSYIEYKLPTGSKLRWVKTGISYWNYDYFFKTEKFTRKEFWRFAKAYKRHFGTYKFGSTEKEAFQVFLDMQWARWNKAPYTYTLDTHPKYIREAVKDLNEKQFAYNAWGLL